MTFTSPIAPSAPSAPPVALIDARDAELAARLKALAHPARIAILKALAAREACVCGALVEVLPLAQSTVSEHLRILREAGLVRGRTEGPRSCYTIDRAAAAALAGELVELLTALAAPPAAPDVPAMSGSATCRD